MLRAAIFVCLLSLTHSAFALNSITITAQTIEFDKGGASNATFHNTHAVYDLKNTNTINLKSELIEHDSTQLKNADILVDLNAKTTYAVKAEHIQYNNFEARAATIFFDDTGSRTLTFDMDLKQNIDKNWAKTQVRCVLPVHLSSETWQCNQGKFTAERMNFPFSLEVTPQPKGFVANINLLGANFSDESGLHASEKLTGHLVVVGKLDGDTFNFNSALNWQSGEVFWQPLYIANGGHEFQATGSLKGDVLTLDSAVLKLDKVGDLNFKGKVSLKTYEVFKLDADLPNLDLAEAYPLLIKPFLGKTMLNDADLSGKAALSVGVVDSQIKTFTVKLNGVNIADKNKKFIFNDINANIPWSYDEATNVTFSYNDGQLLNMPLGRASIGAEVNRFSLTAPEITLPILDGAFKLSDISAARINDNWYWHLSAALLPISMADATKAFKIPIMQGKASAEIPLVTYSGGILTTDGEMSLSVFNGKASVTNLVLQNPLGKEPKLNANMRLRNLDLGELTRTFSFGAIEGKLDGDVTDLQLVKWKPRHMDASIYSSPGDYTKKVSQRAVENITALGGAGAAAAIQRTFLRFFKEFNYEKMGISCKLRDDLCEMGGVSSTPTGFVIVKGSGVPAVNVNGYTQKVSWKDVVARIKRITDGNTKAVVK
jgi:hypothetical protein